MECSREEQFFLQNPRNFSPIVCCERYIAVRYNRLRQCVKADDVVDEYLRKCWCVDCFPAGMAMSSLCHVVNKRYNAVVAIFWHWQVGHEVDADSLQMASGNRQSLQEAHWVYRSGGWFGGISPSLPCIVGYRTTLASRNICLTCVRMSGPHQCVPPCWCVVGCMEDSSLHCPWITQLSSPLCLSLFPILLCPYSYFDHFFFVFLLCLCLFLRLPLFQIST